MKRLVILLVQVAIFAACLHYALKTFDFSRVFQVLAAVPLWKALLIFLLQIMLVPMSLLRLQSLCRFETPWEGGLLAQSLAQFLNLLLPAKLGEAAKLTLLTKSLGGNLSRVTEIVFWERFADLNALLALVLASGTLLGGAALALPVALVVGGFWGAVLMLKLWGGHVDRLLSLLPWPKLAAYLMGVAGGIRVRLTPGFAVGLAVLTVPLWLGEVLVHGLVLRWVFGLALTPLQVMAVGTAGLVGLAAPATPGNIGVYEAALVAALMAFGQPQEEALAGALLLHAVVVAPVLLGGVWATARIGFKAALSLTGGPAA